MKKITILFLICSLVLAGCSAQNETAVQKNTIRKVGIQKVNSLTYSDELTLSGNIVPVNTVKLSFKIPGVASEILVDEGDYVKAGQPIAKLDQEDYMIKVKAAQAELDSYRMQIDSEIPAKINQAKAQLDLTKSLYDRVEALYEKNAVTKSQLDEISAKLTVDENTYNEAVSAKAIAEKKLLMAEASLDLANSNISDTTIYSPIDGVILKQLVEAGETVGAGYPIVAIGQVDKVWAQIGVPDEYINSLFAGQKANVYIYGADKTLEGLVDETSSLADAQTRTFPVKIVLDNPESKLKPGMICRVDIDINDSSKITVPLSSIVKVSSGSSVFVYSDSTRTASRRMVETGEILKDRIEVTEGLKTGELVVVEGQSFIRDGDEVAAEEMTE